MTTYIKCPICDFRTVEGDITVVFELIKIHETKHTHPNKNDKAKIDRPKISLGCSSDFFRFFKIKWESFKTLSKLPETEYADHLLECCEEDLKKALYREYEDALT